MPEKPKGPPAPPTLPRNLPMPNYGYQRPVTGSEAAKYDPDRNADRKRDDAQARPRLPALQNLTF